jgi:folate-binding protein YgfZ
MRDPAVASAMRDLPLATVHVRHGANLGERDGWQVPLDYGDDRAEQQAVRQAAGLIDWSARGKVRVTGGDRLAFLDGLLTNDLKPLTAGRGLYAATLDHRARVHGDMVVYDAGDHYLLETDPGTCDRIAAYLNKLLVSDDVALADVTAEHGLFGVFGPRSGAVISGMVGSPPAGPYDHLVADFAGSPVRIARSPYFGGEGYELWTRSGPGGARLWRSLIDEGAVPFGASASEALRIEAGRPRFGVDMDEHTLALEARLEPAISMTKGCYVGQEIVSRAVYQGHLNRLLVGLEMDGTQPPAPGTSIDAQGEPVGTVTSAAASAWRGKVLALGYVRRPASEPGTEVAVGGIPARIAALPFYRG